LKSARFYFEGQADSGGPVSALFRHFLLAFHRIYGMGPPMKQNDIRPDIPPQRDLAAGFTWIRPSSL